MSDCVANKVCQSVPICARCKRAHIALEFSKLTNPIPCGNYETLTHWGMCPTLQQPILMGESDIDRLKINATG